MNEEIMKDILSLKFRVMDSITDKMPEAVRDDIKRLQQEALRALNRATLEFLERQPVKNDGKEIKSVPIE